MQRVVHSIVVAGLVLAWTAGGGTIGARAADNWLREDAPKARADFLIGETEAYRVHLIYQPDRDFLRSNDSALNAEMVESIATENEGGKRTLVFATAKFMGQKELTAKGIEFCQLPYAIHRVLGN